MKTLAAIIGYIITIPFVILESVLKIILSLVCVVISITIAIFYPLVRLLNISEFIKNIRYIFEYSITWKHGFYSGRIYKLWKID